MKKTPTAKNVKVEWCENFINAAFRKMKCTGIEVNCFWNMAEKSGLWVRGTFGTPMSDALLKLTKVETVQDNAGNFLYNVFKLA